MKLFETQSSLAELVDQYLKVMSDPDVVKREFGSDSFDEICTEPGNCSMVSEDLAQWLRRHHVPTTLITGARATNPTWPKRAKVRPGSEEDAHTVVRVGDTVVDLTARQFDPNAKFPKLSTYAQFKSEWEAVDSGTPVR